MSRPLIITTHFNPAKWKSRPSCYHAFTEHMAQWNVRLVTIECALDGQDFEVTDDTNPDHIRVRAEHPLWFKENLINIALQRTLTPDVEHIGWFDADILFQNPLWVQEAQDKLQRFAVIQPWSRMLFLDDKGKIAHDRKSFGAHYTEKGTIGGHTGYAWMMRRMTYDNLGGLPEYCIVGDADHFMGFACVGHGELVKEGVHREIAGEMMDGWQANAIIETDKRVGAIPGDIHHLWHGSESSRGYSTRHKLLEHFNPLTDLTKNADGVIQLVPTKTQLRKDLRKYFLSRNEDTGAGTDR